MSEIAFKVFCRTVATFKFDESVRVFEVPRAPDVALLDRMAMAALEGVIITCAKDTHSGKTKEQHFAERAYMCAKAMLAEREKHET